MKKFVRNSLLAASAVMALSFGSVSAHAGDMVAMSQMRLADLGYFPGRADGFMGPETHVALRDFQSYNGLPVSGTLDADTYNLLMTEDYATHNGGIMNGHIAYVRYSTPVTYTVAAPAATYVSYPTGYSTAYSTAVSYPTAVAATPVYYTTDMQAHYVAASVPTTYYADDGRLVEWRY